MRHQLDWKYEAAKVAHWFPALPNSVGGDPMDLPCEVIADYSEQIVDLENWKNGEKGSEIQQRRFERTLEKMSLTDG